MNKHWSVCLLVAGLSTPAGAELTCYDGPYRVEIVGEHGALPTYQHRGETYVLGVQGERYEIRVHNRSAARVEVVVSVDGRDVIDGTSADYRTKRGYLVSPWGSLSIDGFRISERQAAAFRFSDVPSSYAARMGDPRNVGVIGVAVFPERRVSAPRVWPLERHKPAPAPESMGELGGRSDELEAKESSASSARSQALRPEPAPNLGTEFGERRDSPIRYVRFERDNPTQPAAVLGLRYNDRAGLIAAGIPLGPEDGPWLSADPFPNRFATPPPGWR